ncbi:MAG TPA: cyclic pyranopterin monophosphate synthase MoaC [Acidimicrobiia bacterium]
MTEFPHLTPDGDAHMVDVTRKEVTARRAIAETAVTMAPETSEALFGGSLPKGDALASARLAGIMAAKATSGLIPLCHPIPIDGVEVAIERTAAGARITASVTTVARTGVEMEAMTAVSVAALAIYDMVKGLDRGVEIGPTRLLSKEGGRSGLWTRGGGPVDGQA